MYADQKSIDMGVQRSKHLYARVWNRHKDIQNQPGYLLKTEFILSKEHTRWKTLKSDNYVRKQKRLDGTMIWNFSIII